MCSHELLLGGKATLHSLCMAPCKLVIPSFW
jgi:hypothetical protein